MALCVNQSGTWRRITTLCVNDSGSWRNILIGCINQSGTWRKFGGGGTPPTTLGSSYGGGTAICFQSGFAGGVVWVAAPSSTGVRRTWFCRNDAVTTAQANAPCGDWFIPTCDQHKDPGYKCKIYWDYYTDFSRYFKWSSTEYNGTCAWYKYYRSDLTLTENKTCNFYSRAFRCVTY